tara:strand:- start:14639 stop:19189 length:4551 start_codon:yes stop_codon:yes gene_type:complete
VKNRGHRLERIVILFILFAFGNILNAQNISINANGAAPDNSAMLDVSSNNRGILIPRMTLIQRNAITNPATGLLIYQTDNDSGFYFNRGTSTLPSWSKVAISNEPISIIQDLDGNTKIEVEQNPNEDLIRFGVGGTEFFIIDSARFEILNTNNNIFIGENSGQNFNYLNNSAEPNLAIGPYALELVTTGNKNVAIGYQALQFNRIGGDNTAVGLGAARNNDDGSLNTAIGAYSIFNNISGSLNTAVGRYSLYNMNGGTGNTVMGEFAASALTLGDANTIIGNNSMIDNLTGSNNTVLGAEAGRQNLGGGNVFLGYAAGYSASGSNKLYIENSISNNPLIYGDFANDSIIINGAFSIGRNYTFPSVDGAPNQVLQTNGAGNLNWANISGDNLGNHIATTNIELNGNYLSGDGDNEGVFVDNVGNVGVGTATPSAKIDVVDNVEIFSINITNSTNSTSDKKGIFSTVTGGGLGNNYGLYGEASAATVDKFGVYGSATGAGGTKYGIYGNAQGAGTNWAGYFENGNVLIENRLGIGIAPTNAISVAGNIDADTAFMDIVQTDSIWIAGLQFPNPTVADSGDVLSFNGTNMTWSSVSGDNLGNHIATSNIELNGNYLSGDGDNEGIFIDNLGNIGIGSATPSSRLTINTVGGAEIEFTGISNADIISSTQLNIISSATTFIDASEIIFRTNLTERLRILNNGNVGIGTSTPANRLEVIGDAVKFDSVIIVNGAQAGYVLTAADATGAASWQPRGGAIDLDSLTDVSLTAPVTNNFLRYNGINWINTSSIFPINETVSAGGTQFQLNHTGLGNTFRVTNTSPFANDYVISAEALGDAIAGYFVNNQGTATNQALYTHTQGSGPALVGLGLGTTSSAARFANTNAGNAQATLILENAGSGLGLNVISGGVQINELGGGGQKMVVVDNNGLLDTLDIPTSNSWALNGNSGTVDGTNFMGTTDNTPLNFRVNNIPAGRIDHIQFNAAFGRSTLQANTIGLHNTAVGNNAMIVNSTGSRNSAFGSQALQNGNSDNNVAIGFRSLIASTGGNNTALGFQSGNMITTGSLNTFIGYDADASSNNLINATAIGANASVAIDSALVLGNNANVGIGTSSPHAPLQFANANANRKIVLFEGADNDHEFFGFGINGGILRYQVNAPGNHVFYTSSSPTTSTELMRIGGNGNVGIGTSAPIGKLEVAGDGSLIGGLRVSGTTAATVGSSIYLDAAAKDWTITATNTSSGAGTDKLVFRDYSLAQDRMTIDGSGNVGIGTTNPNTRLQVHATSGAGNLQLTSASTGINNTDGFFLTNDGGTEFLMWQRENANWGFITHTGSRAMTISPNSFVGIGTATPTSQLEVAGDIEIPAVNNYTYSTPKTHYQSFAPTTFNSLLPDVYDFGTLNAATYYSYFRSGGTAFGYATVEVNLPDGADVRELRGWIYDNLTTNPVRVQLMRQQLGSAVTQVMVEIESDALTASAAVQDLASNTVINNIIDNANYSYFLMFTGRQNSADSRLYGTRITYNVTVTD